MKGLFWLLILFSAAVGIAYFGHLNEGYVLLVLPPYRTEMALSLAIFILFVCFVLIYVLLRLSVLTSALPGKVQKFCEQKKDQKEMAILFDAIRLVFEGRFDTAMKQVQKVESSGALGASAALIGAYSANRLREPEKQKGWLDLAFKNDPKFQAACSILEAKSLIDREYYDEAEAALKYLGEASSKNFPAHYLMLRIYQGRGQWDDVLRTVRLMEKDKAIDLVLGKEAKLKAHSENINQRALDLNLLKNYWASIPHGEDDPRLAYIYAKMLIGLEDYDAAQRFIEARLEEYWCNRLIGLYGRIQEGDLTERVARAEKWKVRHGKDADLLLALARMYIQQGLWDQVVGCLMTSLFIKDQAEARLVLADLMDRAGQQDMAVQHYRCAAQEAETLVKD